MMILRVEPQEGDNNRKRKRGTRMRQTDFVGFVIRCFDKRPSTLMFPRST
jgi:hypothetical protein